MNQLACSSQMAAIYKRCVFSHRHHLSRLQGSNAHMANTASFLSSWYNHSFRPYLTTIFFFQINYFGRQRILANSVAIHQQCAHLTSNCPQSQPSHHSCHFIISLTNDFLYTAGMNINTLFFILYPHSLLIAGKCRVKTQPTWLFHHSWEVLESL